MARSKTSICIVKDRHWSPNGRFRCCQRVHTSIKGLGPYIATTGLSSLLELLLFPVLKTTWKLHLFENWSDKRHCGWLSSCQLMSVVLTYNIVFLWFTQSLLHFSLCLTQRVVTNKGAPKRETHGMPPKLRLNCKLSFSSPPVLGGLGRCSNIQH